MESAGVTLVRGDHLGVAQAIRLSRAAMRNIRQNLIFAFGYNTIGIPIAAGVLFPAFGLLVNPLLAAASVSLSRSEARRVGTEGGSTCRPRWLRSHSQKQVVFFLTII